MIENAFFYINRDSDNPYETLALEEAMMHAITENDIIMYLYIHRPSVIIGKNQNVWKECRISELEKDGGILARRISGGGAVYHDYGNLNFSFITNNRDYDTARQLSVIAGAVSDYGIHAELSGRNDIMAYGKKFSGNAFCFKKNMAFHHGTILVDVDKDSLVKYLSVSQDKIRSKGIESVRSRVCNLREFSPDITVDSLAESLKSKFFHEYGNGFVYMPGKDVLSYAAEISERNKSWEWKFGYQGNFDINMRKRFAWGDAEICLSLKDAVITDAVIYSDAMDAEYIDKLASTIRGKHFASSEISSAVMETVSSESQHIIADDITAFIREKTSC